MLAVSDYSAGEARLAIVPDMRRFKALLEADMRKIREELKIPVGADTKPAERDTEKFREEQKRKPVKTQLEMDVEQAQDKLRALRIREEAKKLGLKVDVDADTRRAKLQLDLLRAEAESRKITVRLDADTSSFRNKLNDLFGGGGGGGRNGGGGGGRGLSGFLTGPIGIPLIFTGIGELPAATTAIANVAGALQQLSGAGAAIPGIIGGVVSEVGTVKLAMTGVADAFTALDKASDGSAKNVQAANDALAKLAPQAADFVRQVSALKPAFDGLTKNVQGKFFDDLSTSVKNLASADLPVLNKGLGGIATALNGSLKQLGISLSSGSSQGLLDRIFGNTAEAQTRLTKAIDPLIQGIGTLTAAGTDVLPRLADDVGKISQRFSNFITASDKDGSLSKFINDGITGVEHLGETALSVGKIFGDITKAAGGDGGLLKFLDEGAAKLHAFLSSTEGQNQLKTWFEEGRREIQEHIIPLLKALPGFFEGLYNAGRAVADIVVPPLRDISKFLSEHPDLIKTAAEAFVAFKVTKGMTDVIGSLTQMSGLLGGKGGKGGGITAGLSLLTAGTLAQVDAGYDPKNAQQQGIGAITSLGGAALIGASVGGPIGAAAGVLIDAAGQMVSIFKSGIDAENARKRKEREGTGSGPVAPGAVAPLPTLSGPNTAVAPPTGVLKPATPAGGPADLKGILAGGALGGNPGSVTDPTALANSLATTRDQIAGVTKDLGVMSEQITQLPSGEVFIKDGSTPTVIKALEDLGFKVKSLPDGQLIVRVKYLDPAGKLVNPGIGAGVGLSPGYATGGVLPGYSPGKDNMLVPLAGGEGIVRPEAVKKFGPGVIHMLNQGFAPGGIVPDFAAILAGQGGGTAPGPIAPNPTQGGLGSLANSFLGGLGGMFGNVSGLIGGATGGSGGSGLTPGLAGLFQAGTDQNLLGQWGQQTGDWLGNFAAKTLLSLGTSLWSGALGFFGLQDSILSPSNPWFQDAAKGAGFFLGQDGPLGGQGGKGSKGPTEKQLREGQQKIGRADRKVAEIQQRIAELKPNAKQSQRQSLADQLSNAQQDAQDARTDFGTLQSGGTPTSTSSASVPSGVSGNQAVVYQAMLDAGFSASEWPALLNLMNKESGFVPTAKNPKSTAYGMFQFLDSTWGTVGGSKTADPVLQARYGLQYIKQRYGTPSAAWAQYYNHPGGEGSYASGGGVGGSGRGDTVPAMLTPGEHVLTTNDVAAMGGQKGVYAFREALHFAPGGAVPSGVVIQPLPPLPRPVALPVTRPNTPPPVSAPRPVVTPTAPTLPAPADAQSQAPQQQGVPGSPTPVAPVSGDGNHNLPWVNLAIESGAAALGNIASSAIGAAGGGIPGLGSLGGFASGLIKEGGKVVEDVVNVGSSLLVGSVPGSFGDPNLPAGGQTLRPAQRTPQTAPLNHIQNNTFNGHSVPDVMQELDLRQARDRQAQLAQWGG